MIKIIGIGPGDAKYLTQQATVALSKSPCIIGTQRQLETIEAFSEGTLLVYNGKLSHLEELMHNALKAHDHVALVASGDPSFYGISQWVRRTFEEEQIDILNGIGSYQILFSKTGYPMHDIYLTSLHGRTLDPKELTAYKRLCVLTDTTHTPYKIARLILDQGQNPMMIIGESLSYENEKIEEHRASDVADREYEMNVVIIDYER
ncbi:precorrin-6y C5,15-methyltransferase (decarboxylating) subunit CbiE [Fusibacter ferrireducens]|uniref:Precorrin-6y C5,15-methyltransferase (Decarboxylating) subunit CbiE n=1 Tax=Fusibacter ferrireducens TaxID=2785058 RepID=A0ABR9ZTG8_9FIRM|nr:precorrin-6y C5,15-methyltransferase (decarboxylating) subunit CbiE [Fusibacter ferrireducens]MBF4693256.1 precorrin-6y C5,15-methyltransferase (decarboxylating) subunit CbiE [Fusibacter ferrireducens]